MKNCLIITLLAFLLINPTFAKAKVGKEKISLFTVNEDETSVTFPAGYVIGDYVEFVRVQPYSVGSSGYYNISISYTRSSIASAATHLAAISHANPPLWCETGQINDNKYVDTYRNFTIDCNGEYNNPRFRIRATGTHEINEPLTVYIKITSVNLNCINQFDCPPSTNFKA